jgi:Mg/Co/Ni transporter MgtE
MITADDVVEVIQEEASEDILWLGGVAGDRCLTRLAD